MNTKEFMEQKLKDVSVKELTNAIRIKLEEPKKEEPKPVLFEGVTVNFEVSEMGVITVLDARHNESLARMNNSLPALYKAVELSKKRRNV